MQVLLRLANHRLRHAGEARHLQAIALARRAFLHRVQEHHAVLVLDRVEMHVGDFLVLERQPRELEVVRREQAQ